MTHESSEPQRWTLWRSNLGNGRWSGWELWGPPVVLGDEERVEVMPVSEHEEAMVKIHDALLRGNHPTLTPVSRSLAVGATDAFVQRIQEREAEIEHLRQAAAVFLGDTAHPDWADYVATNLLDALQQVPDTGDWHGALKAWCERTITGRMVVNRTGDPAGQKRLREDPDE